MFAMMTKVSVLRMLRLSRDMTEHFDYLIDFTILNKYVHVKPIKRSLRGFKIVQVDAIVEFLICYKS